MLLRQWAAELADAGSPPLAIVIDQEGASLPQGTAHRPAITRLSDHNALIPFIRNWLDTRARGVVMIDDGHLLSDAMAREICALFLTIDLHDHALVFATRRHGMIPLARARVLRLVRDIDARELRLTRDDLQAHAHHAFRLTLDVHAASELLQATGGWPVAVDIYLRRAEQIGPAAMLRELQRGSRLMDDFFAEEIMQPLPMQLQDFLVDSSVLGTLTADACNAALGIDDGGERLDEAVRAGLFIEAMDGCKRDFRLLPLFSEFLRSQLRRRGRARHDAIALDGAAWFERNERLPEAFDCAVRAQDWNRAATLLDIFGIRGSLARRGELVTEMALELPRDVLRRHPRAAIFAARGASAGWRFGLVENFLQLADEAPPRDGAGEVESLVMHGRMLAAQYADDQIAAGRKCLDLLERIDTFDHFTRGTIFGSLLYARREQFDFTDAIELELSAVREFNLGERRLGMVWHLSVVGPTHAMRGDLSTATRRLEEASTIAAGLIDTDWIASVPALLKAEICYERNHLVEARALIDLHRSAPLVGIIDQYVAGYVTGSRLLWLDGDVAAAHRRLDDGMALAESRSLERLRQAMIGERIRLLLSAGQQQRALGLGRQENLLGASAAVAPSAHCTTRDEMRAIAWFRLALARGEFSQAIDAGQVWKRFTAKAGAMQSAMRWEILLAQGYAAQGQTARAQREPRSALDLAVTGGYVRSFLDEGDHIRRLLQEQLKASAIHTSATDDFVAGLLQAGEQGRADLAPAAGTTTSTPRGGIEPLTKAQITILQMASAGLQNREIAQRIGMTEGSVKWYMQQIFNKIGVRKRAGALDRAKALGLA
ncbi:hypothetical protein JQ629_19460 [Bradyrhizobium sp. AUGA SZCCT0222]|uniref:LuxR C-terminal-related transcriptional regulator n=1 Tax=Bradyrhizobium sp. AUGA SZCCT0222 TaxID=2807668 RepID=UPI001BA7EEE4|nr:LuxR C-terminal-related transcriptional regulator [Bradyrhizobium sp. AUGA SZCCT0222]MBR1269692.1 hypothetical protein [Bradyrhizobium sp. AUGA SZCCT0222]